MEGRAALAVLAALGVARAARAAVGPGAAPELLLQLQFERGAPGRVSLRAGGAGGPGGGGRPCAELCHAGLGGAACGAACADMVPVGLAGALAGARAGALAGARAGARAGALRRHNQSEVPWGRPRYGVCPALCASRLGTPLCACPESSESPESPESSKSSESPESPGPPGPVQWDELCAGFCRSGGYVLAGCPACERPAAPEPEGAAPRPDAAGGWAAWCGVQCRQGLGGAACNCDRTPFQ